MTEEMTIHQREDNAEVKRVELNVYTKMSQFPNTSVVSAKELIRTAARWGWDAVAITDHAVVQAFPDAMNTVIEDRLNIKVIYGMIGNLIEETDFNPRRETYVSILIKNKEGLRHLYQIVSLSNLRYNYGPYGSKYIPRYVLKAYREGFLLGSSGVRGELIRAVAARQSEEKLLAIARFYDYLEIQPIGCYVHLIHDRFGFPGIRTDEDLRDINRKIAEIANKLGKMLVATGAVCCLNPEDAICHKVLGCKGDVNLYSQFVLRTTDEMLREFDYLGEGVAYEAVVTNPRRIADMVERIKPLPDDWHWYPPELPYANERIKKLSYQRAHELYGEQLPKIVQTRLDQELKPIFDGFSTLYLIAHELVKESNDGGYPAFARGSVGASFVATMTGITEVNPLPPHWRCPKCHYSEFLTDGSYNSGFDLPDKNCPNCGEPLVKDGHDIPFAVFLGYDGEKVPVIDLNYADVYRSKLCKHVEWFCGKDKVYVAGTIATLSKKDALLLAKKYFEQKGETPSDHLIQYIVNRCEGVKKTEAYSDGVMIVPQDMDIHFFTPIQHPNGQAESDVIVTHFDYHAISCNLVKFNILGHDVPTRIKMMEDYSHCDHRTISFNDSDTFSLFQSTEALGVSPEDLGATTGTLGVPEFQSSYARRILDETKPTCFSDLVKISGFCHGTEIWKGNMQDALRDGVCTLHDAISARDDIMMYLIHKGIEPLLSFKTMERARKSLGIKPDVVEQLKAGGVPEWYIEACQKVKYLFPRAHAVSYVMMAYRIAYYKVHYPLAFYAAFFSVNDGPFDVDVITAGKEAVRKRISELQADYPDLEEDVYKLDWERYEVLETVEERILALQVALEMLLRGFTLEPVDPNRADAEQFIIFDKYKKPLFAVHSKS